MNIKSFIHSTAIVYPNVVVEEGVYIGPYCVVGSPPEWKGREYLENKGVLIKQGSRLTGFVAVDAGAERQTIVGENCYLMKHSYVGHDSILENNVTLSAGVKIGGYVYIEEGANLGMNATVHQKIRIPKQCMIGASSFVGKKSILKPEYKYAGVPVRELGPNIIRK